MVFLLPDNKKEIVRSYMLRAVQTLSFIQGYINNADYYTAVSRSYYAAFYAIKALELKDDYDDYSKHSAVISCFRLNYIKTGTIESEYSDLIGLLSEDRTSVDYNVLVDFSREEAVECFEAASKIINKISELI